MESGHPSNRWFDGSISGPTRVHLKRHHDRFSRFCGAHGRDRQTERPLYSVNSNRPHLASAAMRPRNSPNNIGAIQVDLVYLVVRGQMARRSQLSAT